MHRKLRPDHPNIGTNIGAVGWGDGGEPCTPWSNAPRHNKQFVIKRRRTGVIVGKKSNGSPVVPSVDHARQRRDDATFVFKGLVERRGAAAVVDRLE